MNTIDFLLNEFEKNDINFIFMNPGTTEIPFLKSLVKFNIQPILCLQENIMTGASDGYGRITEKPCLNLLHLGTGFSNGLSNLHNANKAYTPIINIVGNIPVSLLEYNSIVNLDIDNLVKVISKKYFHPKNNLEFSNFSDELFSLYKNYISGEENINTLILPYDLCNQYIPEDFKIKYEEIEEKINFNQDEIKSYFLKYKRKAILIGGLIGTEDILNLLENFKDNGIDIFVESKFGKLDRCYLYTEILRLPYFPEKQMEELAKYDFILIIGTNQPVSQFGLKGENNLIPSNIKKVTIKQSKSVIRKLLNDLILNLGLNKKEKIKSIQKPKINLEEKLNIENMTRVISNFQPKNSIIVDEGVSSSKCYWDNSNYLEKFTHLTLTGGALGSGMPMSIGAALSSPSRKIINIQSDGSSLFCLQSLWTQAKHNLNIITIICNNSEYNVLKREYKRIYTEEDKNINELCFELDNPKINYSEIAKGYGVSSIRVYNIKEFIITFKQEIHNNSPFLIEVMLSDNPK